MGYNPFQGGPNPVGVSSSSWRDTFHDRDLVIEIWYPATEQYRGKDFYAGGQDVFLVPGLETENEAKARQAAVRDAKMADGILFAVVLAHGFPGHRRQSTFLGTHLASCGFLVVSADHKSSTFPDIDELMKLAKRDGRLGSIRTEVMTALVANRCTDIPFMIDTVVKSFDVNQERVVISGASFGGWTSLMAPSLDYRIKASAPTCPSGGETPKIPRDRNVVREVLDFYWKTNTATLFMVADRDSRLPLYGKIELFRRSPDPKRFFILERADHNHFLDDIKNSHERLPTFTMSLAEVEVERGTDWRFIAKTIARYAELRPEEKVQMCGHGLCVAHMDARLRQSKKAQGFLKGDVLGALAERGIDAVEISDWSRM